MLEPAREKRNHYMTDYHHRRKGSPCYDAGRRMSAHRTRRKHDELPHVQPIVELRKRPCADCGITLPWQVMELDHVRGTKTFTLAIAHAKTHTAAEILTELEKVEPRCPTCHQVRHHYAQLASIEATRAFVVANCTHIAELYV